MVQLEEARKAPPAFAEASAGWRLALPGKAGAGGAHSGLESLAGFEHLRMDMDQHGWGAQKIEGVPQAEFRVGKRQTRSRIAGGYFNVNNKMSIRNDLHSSNVESEGSCQGKAPPLRPPAACLLAGRRQAKMGRPSLIFSGMRSSD